MARGADIRMARKETLKERNIISHSSGSALNNKIIACCVADERSFMIFQCKTFSINLISKSFKELIYLSFALNPSINFTFKPDSIAAETCLSSDETKISACHSKAQAI